MPTEYLWPHSKFKKATDKVWMSGRSKYMSSWCTPHNPLAAQGHEGTKPVSAGGAPLKICDQYLTCPCTCHESIDKMFAMMDMPRPEPEQSPDYTAAVSRRNMETQAMLDALCRFAPATRPLSIPDDPTGHRDDEGTVAGTLDPVTGTPATPAPAPNTPTFAPTPTGRRAKGQLEYDVLKVCDDFSRNVYDWEYCTPKLVAEQIGKINATEPPSTGPINAVWDRWEKIDFAVQGKKPSRFLMFKDGLDGSIHTLETVKSRYKRQAKMFHAEAKRGTLRPRGR